MSLFKAPTFWSFDLGRLAAKLKSHGEEQPGNGDDQVADSFENDYSATFIARPGQFHSIGAHDVLVCGNLKGLICIVQVPKENQLRQINEDGTDQAARRPTSDIEVNSTSEDLDSIDGRQLLCAKNLDYPIVDIRCGHFVSALKQSIAVISFNKLVIYQVKRQQIDLVTEGPTLIELGDEFKEEGENSRLEFDHNLFSHDLEEHHRLDLFPGEIAFNLVIVDRQQHARRSTKASKHQRKMSSAEGRSSNEASSNQQESKSDQHNINLPQRDSLIVQYTNQFLLTIVDYKKIVGNFQLVADNKGHSTTRNASIQENRLLMLSQFVGAMSMAYLHEIRCPSLVIALSDQRIHCIPLAKFIALARQSVVHRVAKNLMLNNDHQETVQYGPSNEKISLETIKVNLESTASWKLELVCAPLQLTTIQRLSSTGELSASNVSTYSQLLVMSRYNLDLFSSTGAHIWSQRFETPLICMCNYVIETNFLEENRDETKRHKSADRLMSLICVDCLSDSRSNLLILEEERTVWSAQLNSKPAQIWRTNLQQMTGTVTSLSISDNLLSSSYLGISSEQSNLGEDERSAEGQSDEGIAKLEQLNESLFENENIFRGQTLSSDANLEQHKPPQPKRKLQVHVRLEASEQWPNVSVDSVISIRPDLSCVSTALQNIKVVLEFDDLFKFEQVSNYPLNIINEGALEVQLGSCWPDRREPVRLMGRFSIRDATSAEAAEALSGTDQQVDERQLNWMPKTLQVNLQFRFTESRSDVWFQDESFLLPLNMVARLVHIDYSTGQNQSLEDIQSNLSMYKRPQSISLDKHEEPEMPKQTYFLCDLFIRTRSELLDVIDELIESDLICRGLNSESVDYDRELKRGSARKLSTLENISLLAQSLDCRLKYKSLPHVKGLVKETSIDDLDKQTIMISIALKIPTLFELIKGINEDDHEARFSIIWLHLCDLSSSESGLPEELIRQHMKEWKVYNDGLGEANHCETSSDCFPILVSIECEYPVPVLFLMQHLLKRLRKRTIEQADDSAVQQTNMGTVNEQVIDSIDIDFMNLLKMDSFVAIDNQLHDSLKMALNKYNCDLKGRFNLLRENLDKEYRKFQVTTMRSLSLSKRLSNMPENMHQQFNNLSLLIKQYQTNLNRILSELMTLQKLQNLYGKIPGSRELWIDIGSGRIQRWPSLGGLEN